jgi:predicted membrane metal-binding protein
VTSAQIAALLPLAFAALVVVRFARRELRERTVSLRTLWIRPVLLLIATGYVWWACVRFDPTGTGELVVASLLGIALGVVAGILIVRNTTFRPAGVAHAVRAQGNRVTFLVWIGALVVRLGARYVVPHGTSPLAQLPLNGGTVALVAAAFTVIAAGFAREVGRTATTGLAVEA